MGDCEGASGEKEKLLYDRVANGRLGNRLRGMRIRMEGIRYKIYWKYRRKVSTKVGTKV